MSGTIAPRLVADQAPLAELDELRRRIDALDDDLLRAMTERIQVAAAIGAHKAARGLPVYQAERWHQVLTTRVARAHQLGLDEAFTRQLFHLIHGRSLQAQLELAADLSPPSSEPPTKPSRSPDAMKSEAQDLLSAPSAPSAPSAMPTPALPIAINNVGDGILARNASWSFGADVPKTFAQHVRRSVPLYDQGHDLICQISDFFVRNDSVCYELGTSTGELLGKVARYNSAKKARWIGIDVEPPMIQQARAHLAEVPNATVEVGDAITYTFEKSDFIVAYYTVQFIPPKHRQELLTKLYESLNWGGAFLLFEKVRGADARFQDLATSLYREFKLKNAFTPDEIISKDRSLKGVLEPFSTQGNLDLLRRAGFVDVMSVMKYVCFEGFLAIK